MDLAAFQRRNGLRFHDEALLRQALTHRSWPYEQVGAAVLEGDNERLEFLGDAVLAFAVSRTLFERFPAMSEGELTRLRAALVRSETLAGIAANMGLGEVLRLGRGEAQSGGRHRRNILCDAFEALLGALYLDQGQAAAEAFVVPRLLPLVAGLLEEGLVDARTRLQEWSQAQHYAPPTYELLAESGPDHEKQFTVVVRVLDEALGTGKGGSKQAAAQAAAKAALSVLRNDGRLRCSGVE